MKYIQTKEGHIYRVHNPETWEGSTVLSDKAGKAAYREQQKNKLREWIKPGATVYTVLKHVSESGMSRRITPLIVHPDGEIMNISCLVSDVLEWRWNDEGSVVVGGCGMDMGWHLVYCLSRCLFPDGFGTIGSNGIVTDLRPLTREKAVEAVAAGYHFRGRNGDTSGWDNDGGYALTHRWL